MGHSVRCSRAMPDAVPELRIGGYPWFGTRFRIACAKAPGRLRVFIRHLPRVETFVSTASVMFKAALAAEIAANAEKVRRRLLTKSPSPKDGTR